MALYNELAEERLSSLMAKRLNAEYDRPPVPEDVKILHEMGYLAAQIAHYTRLSRVDVERFVKRLPPFEAKRYAG